MSWFRKKKDVFKESDLATDHKKFIVGNVGPIDKPDLGVKIGDIRGEVTLPERRATWGGKLVSDLLVGSDGSFFVEEGPGVEIDPEKLELVFVKSELKKPDVPVTIIKDATLIPRSVTLSENGMGSIGPVIEDGMRIQFWREVPGFPNYEISNARVVRNKRTLVELKPIQSKTGEGVRLYKAGERIWKNLDALVEEVFPQSPLGFGASWNGPVIDIPEVPVSIRENASEGPSEAVESASSEDEVLCKHCAQPMKVTDDFGVHVKNGFNAKVRCDTDLSGLPYGYCAESKDMPCSPICRGRQV